MTFGISNDLVDKRKRKNKDLELIETSFNYLINDIKEKNRSLNEKDKVNKNKKKDQTIESKESYKEDFDEEQAPIIRVKFTPKTLSRTIESPVDEFSDQKYAQETDDERRIREFKDLSFKRVDYKSQNDRRSYLNKLEPLTPKIHNSSDCPDLFIYPYARLNRELYQPFHSLDQIQEIKAQLSEEILTKISRDLKRIYEMHEELRSIQIPTTNLTESYVQTDEIEAKNLPMKQLLLDGRPIKSYDHKFSSLLDRPFKNSKQKPKSPFNSYRDEIFLSPVRGFQPLKPLKKKKNPKIDTDFSIPDNSDKPNKLPTIDLKVDNNKLLERRYNKNRKPIDVNSVYSLTDSEGPTQRSDDELTFKPFRLYKIVNENSLKQYDLLKSKHSMHNDSKHL